MEEAKDYLMNRLDEMPQLKDINENVALGKQEIRLDLKPKAYFLGLDESAIARQVRQGFYGGQAQRLQEGRDELRSMGPLSEGRPAYHRTDGENEDQNPFR